ncbi:Txe/YoeB family toxin of toxin-antitoxin system [Pedobacter africanus]|uniref:Txe/YoeB family toxin of toxin-antitoxin system n=1 Tax=Pedobacter africanus TaxID=151894 RepID=A0ACC6KVS6_9SPHI|nr:Txe/YoeB family addiction module toxin [Pedobacter africanus]MDR6783349.1 Txe/YoeB family toxin of toxin-antitoxin system [Pedobacter africanus]
MIKHPYEGIGKPEALKYDFSGQWSRRINSEHRIIYDATENVISVYSLKGHY